MLLEEREHFTDIFDALDAMSSGSAADVGEQAALELLLEQAAEVDSRAERRTADVVAPQLQAQEASIGRWTSELALENAALSEMRRRMKLLSEAVNRQLAPAAPE